MRESAHPGRRARFYASGLPRARLSRSALQLKRRHLTAVTRAYLTGRRFLLEALVGCPRLLADQDIYPVKDQFELGV